MRFLVDANLPRSAFELFITLGHAAEFVRDIGLGTAPDAAVAARARETGAAIVTRDLDFSDIRLYPPGEYAGIMVLRLPDDSTAQDICKVLLRFLNQTDFVTALGGRLAIVEEQRVRFRPRYP